MTLSDLKQLKDGTQGPSIAGGSSYCRMFQHWEIFCARRRAHYFLYIYYCHFIFLLKFRAPKNFAPGATLLWPHATPLAIHLREIPNAPVITVVNPIRHDRNRPNSLLLKFSRALTRRCRL